MTVERSPNPPASRLAPSVEPVRNPTVQEAPPSRDRQGHPHRPKRVHAAALPSPPFRPKQAFTSAANQAPRRAFPSTHRTARRRPASPAPAPVAHRDWASQPPPRLGQISVFSGVLPGRRRDDNGPASNLCFPDSEIIWARTRGFEPLTLCSAVVPPSVNTEGSAAR